MFTNPYQQEPLTSTIIERPVQISDFDSHSLTELGDPKLFPIPEP